MNWASGGLLGSVASQEGYAALAPAHSPVQSRGFVSRFVIVPRRKPTEPRASPIQSRLTHFLVLLQGLLGLRQLVAAGVFRLEVFVGRHDGQFGMCRKAENRGAWGASKGRRTKADGWLSRCSKQRREIGRHGTEYGKLFCETDTQDQEAGSAVDSDGDGNGRELIYLGNGVRGGRWRGRSAGHGPSQPTSGVVGGVRAGPAHL